jgi:hypothetical protein
LTTHPRAKFARASLAGADFRGTITTNTTGLDIDQIPEEKRPHLPRKRWISEEWTDADEQDAENN